MAALPARRTRRPTASRQRAYTLHEALIALAVAGIVATVAAPALLKFIEHQQLTSAANSLVTALMTARSESIMRTVQAVLCPTRDGTRCAGDSGTHTEWHHGYLLFVDDNANHQRDPEERVLRVFDKTLRIRVYSSSHRDHVTYRPDGLATGTNATFLFCGEDGVALRILVLSNTGRARLDSRPETCPSAPG